MLRIWKLSGEELTALPAMELSDVKALKHSLRRRNGFPVSLQQLFHHGCRMDDTFKLGSCMDLQLVLLPMTLQSEVADELRATATSGEVEAARWLLRAGTDKDSVDAFGRTALICASVAGHAHIVRLLLAAGCDTWMLSRTDV